MANLLERSSLVLTPTAYNNGEALCIKPDDASGDFQFSRNSAATRVNAQGLVENVQILSSNLVQNGDFSEEGVQEVSNGSFTQEGAELLSQPVNLVTDFTTNSGGVIVDADTFTTSGGSLDGIKKSFLTVGKYYKLVIEGDTTSSGFTIGSLGNSGNEYGSGFGTHYFECINSGLWVRQNTSGTTNITSFSVVEVGQDWTLGGEVTIGDNLAHFESNTNTYSYIRQDIGSLTTKTYKIQLEVKNYVSGAVQVAFSGASPIAQNLNVSSDGVYTAYLTPNANGDDFEVSREFNGGNFNFDITNISVKEVGQNWDLVSANASIGENKLIANSVVTENIATQSGVVPISKPIILKFDLILNSGGFRVLAGSGGTATNITTSGTYTLYETSGTGGTLTLQSRFGSFDGSVTNLSIIQVTSDTNLPRINYEGFSYQDALGSELVTNGDFSNGSTGWLNVGQQNANNTNTFSNGKVILVNDGTGSGISQPNILNIGKTYQVEIVVSEIVGNGFKIYTGTDYFITSTGTFTFQVISTIDNLFYIYRNQTNPQAINGATIDNVSVKEYLGQEVVPDSGCGSWLFEPQSTNTIIDSNSNFLAFNMDLIYNNVKSPDGTQNAFKATTTTTSGAQFRPNQTITTPSTFSIFLKYGNNQWYQVINSSATGFYANIDVENGVFGTSGADTDNLSVKDYGNGWYRFSGTFTSASTNGGIRVYASSSSSAGWAGVSAPIGSYVYGYGFQVEALNYATSYIPTSGSTVTRNQDVCNNGGSLATINSTEGVLYAEIAINPNDDGSFRLISMTDASDSVRIGFGKKDNEAKWYIKILIGALNITSQAIDFQEGFQKIAIRYKSGDSGVYINGTKVITDTSNYVNTLIIDNVSFDFTGNAFPFFGKTKALAVWKEALSDQELTELTTI